MITLYGDIISGNCYKAYLLMSLLDIKHQWCALDIMQGEAATSEFTLKNPNAKVPMLELDDGKIIVESNAILNYLAYNSQYLPQDRYLNAKVLEWQFFEQYSHEPYIAVARFINKYQGLPESRKAEYQSKKAGGHKALSVMERQLSQTQFLIGEQPTIADISLYAYTHVADEGGFDLTPYESINRWLKAIQSLPNYIGMELKAEHAN